jgi:hypothetical protein
MPDESVLLGQAENADVVRTVLTAQVLTQADRSVGCILYRVNREATAPVGTASESHTATQNSVT